MKNLEKLGVRTEDLQLEELTIEDLPPELDRVMTEEPVSSLQNHIGFFKIFLKKNLSGTLSECQTVSVWIRADKTSVLK